MSHVRDLWADLRDRRLWPIAAALLIALVAIPVALGRSGGTAATPAPVPPPLPATAATSGGGQVVSLATGTASRARVQGRPHNPFRGGGSSAAKKDAATAAAPVMATPSVPASPTQAPAPAAVSPTSTPPAPAPAPATTPAADPTPAAPKVTGVAAGYRTDISYGLAGSAKRDHDVLRLRSLNASDGPLALYVGVREDRKTALFLLTGDAVPTGDGRCLPSVKDCQLLALRRGDSEFFDVATGTAGVEQYELYIEKVAQRRAATHTKAGRLRHRESKQGRKRMYAAIDAGATWMRHIMYSSRRGVLFTHDSQSSPPGQ